VGIALIAATAIAALIFGPSGESGRETIQDGRVPFDGEQWRLGPIDNGEQRRGMARDLIATKKLIGMKSQEILQLLGEPTYRDKRSGELGYELNEEHRDGNIDPTTVEHLVISFTDDRASEAHYSIWRDTD
jgi:hypothetical protein